MKKEKQSKKKERMKEKTGEMTKKSVQKPSTKDDKTVKAEKLEYDRERRQFRTLLMSNPNYFGNLKVSPFKPVLSIQSNTTYEEIGCVGFQPQFDRLEAVVYVNQSSGYGGGICSNGTPEYVRFYMSTDNGISWDDLGMTGFTAYNIPEGTKGPKRLEYAVSLEIDPRKRFCFTENIAQIRAILSWNVPPPPNDPNFIPVWGDIHETHIQIDPRRLFTVGDLVQGVELKQQAKLAKVLDLAEPLKATQPKAMEVDALHKLYKDKGVEPHRFALTELQKFVSQPAMSENLMAPGSQGFLPDLDIDLTEIGDLVNPTKSSTRYEELECIGLNPRMDTLVGVIRVKLPTGYSGDLCSAGSREYVTFYADFNNNGFYETCLGTTSVQVYDIDRIPKEGLEYAVFLPVDFTKYRKPCQDGPVVVPIRAIMSWQVPPPCFNPNYVPVWGNRLETLIHIKPGQIVQPGTHFPNIETVGSMDVGDVNGFGLANGPALLAGFTAHDSPFGGEVIITGHIGNTPDISSGAARLKYRIEVSDNGGATWQPVTNTFTLKRDQLLNGIWSDLPPISQSVDIGGWYEYQEDLAGGPGNAMIFANGNVLARWQTSGLNGSWRLRIRVKNPTLPGPEWMSSVVALELDNKAPGADINITSGGGACGDFTINDIISGTYSASDLHFGSLQLFVSPGLGGSFNSPAPLPFSATTMPLIRTYAGGVPTNGESGTWSLDTSGMPKCGYTVRLHVWDRTIVNSGFVGRRTPAVVGLCLREPEK
jgi:hypothetical protein